MEREPNNLKYRMNSQPDLLKLEQERIKKYQE